MIFMDFGASVLKDGTRTVKATCGPYRKLYSIPAGCYHRFIDSSDLSAGLAGWLACWLAPGCWAGLAGLVGLLTGCLLLAAGCW